MKNKSVLPWFGSDASVAKELAAMLDHCSHVTIPFAGGLSILPHLTARGIIANDKHDDAINVYRVIKDAGTPENVEFLARCNATLSHPAEAELASHILAGDVEVSPSLRAWAYWASCWIGRKGKAGTKGEGGGKPSVRRRANGGNNASRLASAANDLSDWAAQFERCEFTCDDFETCLEDVVDCPENGIYVDAPWFEAGHLYRHGFSLNDHKRLRDSLEQFENATVVVRYGYCNEVFELYGDDWQYVTRESRTQANKQIPEIWFVRTKRKKEQQ